MRILYHHRTQGAGVEGVHIREMMGALSRLGHTVDILSPAGFNRDFMSREAAADRKRRILSALSKALPELCFEVMELGCAAAARMNLSSVLRRRRYDLVYERYAIFGTAGVWASRRHGIPLILEVNYTSFTPLFRKRSPVLSPLAHFLDGKIFRYADGIVAVSENLRDHLVALGVPSDRIAVIPNGANHAKFSPVVRGDRVRAKYGFAGKKVIGFVGGFYPWHGLDLLLDAFAGLHGHADAVLFLVGDGPMRPALEAKVKARGCGRVVIFTGRIAHSALPGHIAAFDIAVMPDSNAYGSPMKIFEYMAMGKPVVAPRTGPIAEVITDGREGFLFGKNDREGLVRALKTLLDSGPLRREMGRAGRETIIAEHTWTRNAEKVLEMCGRIRYPGRVNFDAHTVYNPANTVSPA